MRKTKRRILRSKRRVLKTKRRRTQRKFKYQRGGGDPEEELKSDTDEELKSDTEEELKSKVDAAIQNVETKEDEHAQESIKYSEVFQKKLDNLQLMRTLRVQLYDAKNPPKSTLSISRKKITPITPKTITELELDFARAEADDTKLSHENAKIIGNINKLASKIDAEKKHAMPLLENFVRAFPQNTNVDNYNLQIKKYSNDIAEREKLREELKGYYDIL
jgi:hypothetical protein